MTNQTDITQWLEELTELAAKEDLERLKWPHHLYNAVNAHTQNPGLTDTIILSIEDARQIHEAELAKIQAEADNLRAQIKAAVVELAETVSGGSYQAVYNSGRVTWDSKKLEGMSALLPQLNEARKVGKPSVSLRHTGF